jgi:Mlc titration factor MtfA (ptsG expression regulator)
MKRFLVFGLGAAVVGGYAVMVAVRRRNRRILLSSPFPEEWIEILNKNLPPYLKLSSTLRQQLHDLVRIFIAEKSFEGCGGLILTDEIRVTIAAQACMLLLNRDVECYPKLFSILVYPSTYVAGARDTLHGGWEEESVRLGESWQSGAVVLAWDNVLQGAANFKDGHNVTMHEFAHQLDQEDGAGDGTPILGTRSAYSVWARVFSKEYELLQRKTDHGRKSVMHGYGATNPAEFFAVATETFFEKPRQLNKHHPELFKELQIFYKINPLEWV